MLFVLQERVEMQSTMVFGSVQELQWYQGTTLAGNDKLAVECQKLFKSKCNLGDILSARVGVQRGFLCILTTHYMAQI